MKSMRIQCFVVLLGFLFVSGCWGAADHLRRGDELADSELYEEALDEYEKAVKKEPENGEARKRVAMMQKTLADLDAKDGRAAVESGDPWTALDAFKRAIVRRPDNHAHRKALKDVAKLLMAEGDKALTDKRFAESLKIFERLGRELPRLKHAKRGIAQTKEAWSRQLMEEAGQYLGRRLVGNALISLLQLKQLNGVYGDSVSMEEDARRQLRVAAGYGFQVRPGKVKRRNQDGTDELVRLLQQASVPECPGAVFDFQDPKVVLTVALTDLTFKTSKQERQGEQKYQSGTRPVDNPAFLELETKIEQTREKIEQLAGAIVEVSKELEQVREAFADAGPSDDVESLRKRLKDTERKLEKLKVDRRDNENRVVAMREKLGETPRMLDEPVYDLHSYSIFDMTRTATALVALSAREDGNKVLANEPFSASASAEDTTNRAQAKFDVKGDPLEWPKSDEVLAADAYGQVIGQLAGRLGQMCKDWRGQILERAEQASSAAQVEAVEDYVLYLFLGAEPAPQSLVDFLKNERGFDDIEAIRSGKLSPQKKASEGLSI
ncbi:MAG: hypothetical protein JRF33_07385 [Deltaproteobacteria bacterium]|nr:hypothetical protein [Deltaproteobacteria bacterium]